MIRIIVGTAAVLAGFAVLERSVDASTGQAGSCTPTEAYAVMPRGEAVTVRSEPTPQAVVLGTLSPRRGAAEQGRLQVTVTGSQNGWARIALNGARDYSANGPIQAYGWIPADVLTVDARVDGVITAYSRPGMMGQAVATIEGDDMKFRVLGCRGEFLQVVNARHGNVWIDKWCGRPEGCRG